MALSSRDGNLDEPEKRHGHVGDLGLVSLIAYFFCIAAFVFVRRDGMGEGLSSEGALLAFLAFEGALCLTLLLLGMAGLYFSRHDHRGRLSIISGVLMSMGFAFCAVESFTGFSVPPLRLVLIGVSGCGYALGLLVWGRILSVKEPGSSSRQVLADTGAASIVVAVALSLPEMVSMVIVACLGLVAGVVGALRALSVDDADPHAKQVVVSDTRGAIPWSSYFAGGTLWMVCSVFLALLDGMHLFDGRPGIATVVLLTIVEIAVIAGLHRWPNVELSKVLWVSLPLLAIGAVIFAVGNQRFLYLSAILITFSLIVSHMHLMAHFAALAHRPNFLSDQMSAWGWLAPHVGMFVGLLAGLLGIVVGDAVTSLLLPIMVGAIVAVVIATMHSFTMFANRRRKKESTVEAEQQAEAKAEPAVDPQACVDEVFTAMGLTRREKEVASLLLRGRSQAVIARELFVSSTTVNTHIKHIYQKAGVNSKQEFIDLCQ
ncbi:MAG: helix-turn-helix transcriptional regulator [Coriobacteriia bacterium]